MIDTPTGKTTREFSSIDFCINKFFPICTYNRSVASIYVHVRYWFNGYFYLPIRAYSLYDKYQQKENPCHSNSNLNYEQEEMKCKYRVKIDVGMKSSALEALALPDRTSFEEIRCYYVCEGSLD